MSYHPMDKSYSGGSSGGSWGRGRDLKTLAGGRYRIINPVGRGGMSMVYHAYDSQNDRDVAIKVLSLDLASEESFLARFRRESELMRDLNHPNILRAYDFGQEDEIIYLVMSYFGGGTLKDKLANGPLPLIKVTDFLTQIGAGLGYAHSRNIIHRDIKPSNILVHHASDSLVISDFGIAKALSGVSSSLTGTIMGTPLYMAPEQFLDKVDLRSDIYSLGVVLFQLLTGEVPFKGEGLGFQHLNEPVPPFSQYGVNYGPAVEGVIRMALAKKPAERYQRVEDLVAAFNNAAQSHFSAKTQDIALTPTALPDWVRQQATVIKTPVPVPEPTIPTPLPPYAMTLPTNTSLTPSQPLKPKKNRGLLIALLALFLLGLTAGGVGIFMLALPGDKTSPTPTITTQLTTTAKVTTPSTTAATTIATTTGTAGVDQNTPVIGLPVRFARLLFTSFPVGKPEETDIYLYDQKTGELNRLTKTGRDTLPSWSYNGRYIFFQSYRNPNSSAIYQMNPDGSNQTVVVDRARTPGASSLNYRLAYVNIDDGQIYTVNLQNGVAATPSRLTSSSGYKLGPVFSPDDSRLAWTEKDANDLYQIFTLDLTSAKVTPRQITSCAVNCMWPNWSPDSSQLVYNTASRAATEAGRLPLEIWKINADGSNPVQLVSSPRGGGNSHPVWIQDNRGPQGNRIYFNSDRDGGRARIYVMNPDGTSQDEFIPRDSESEDFAPVVYPI